jgi:hypothetical protein
MKQKDIALIIIVIFFSAVISLAVTQTLFSTKGKKSLSAEIVEPINSDFKEPDKTVFNSDAINPTQLIQIGGEGNQNPF